MATTEPEILDMATRLAAAGDQAGLADEEILAVAATMSSLGLEAEAGGTAISRVFREITEAAYTGNESLSVFASTAGMAADEFAQAWQTDPAVAFQSFLSGLDQLSEGEQIGVMQELGLDAGRVSDALVRGASGADLLAEGLGHATGAAGSLTSEVQSATDTASVALSALGEEWRAFLRDLGGGEDGADALQESLEGTALAIRQIREGTSNETGFDDATTATGRLRGGLNDLLSPLVAVGKGLALGEWEMFDEVWRGIDQTTASTAELNAEEMRLAGLAERAGGAIEGQADAHYDAAEGADAQRLSSAELAAELRGQVDPIFGIIDGMSSLRDAQDNYNTVLEDSESTQRDVEDATVDLARANSDLVADILELEGGVDGARDAFRKMRDDGRLTQDQFSTLMGILDGVAGELDDVAGDYDVNVRTVVDTAGIDDVNRRLSELLGRDYTVRIDTYTPTPRARSGGGGGSGSTLPSIPYSAGGGDAWMGAATWVGESGPEVFVPDINGRILNTTDAMRAVSRPAPPLGATSQINSGNTNTFAPTVHVEQRTGNPYQDANVELRKIALAVGF